MVTVLQKYERSWNRISEMYNPRNVCVLESKKLSRKSPQDVFRGLKLGIELVLERASGSKKNSREGLGV